MITLVDYNVGNIGALLNILDYLGIDAQATADAEAIASANQLILPGVGAFDRAMSTLRSSGLIEPLNHAVLQRRVQILGVCLGMQLLSRRSEEGGEPGLGWLAADVKRICLPKDSPLKVPHIGWMETRTVRSSQLFDLSIESERFYFDHSYHMVCDNMDDVAAVFDYGSTLTAAVSHGNIHGVQFHPEKSHRYGMRVLSAFAALGSPESNI